MSQSVAQQAVVIELPTSLYGLLAGERQERDFVSAGRRVDWSRAGMAGATCNRALLRGMGERRQVAVC